MKGIFRLLEREELGLGEIAFDADVEIPGRKKTLRRHFRVFGLLREAEREFVMFIASEKQKRGRYFVEDAPRLAKKYLEAYQAHKGDTSEHF
jgi:hypothetical protein